MKKIREEENQRHENIDPRKPHLYWDGYQWIARPHSTEEIIKLNERKVQLVNMPLNYLKKELEKIVINFYYKI